MEGAGTTSARDQVVGAMTAGAVRWRTGVLSSGLYESASEHIEIAHVTSFVVLFREYPPQSPREKSRGHGGHKEGIRD